MLNRKQKLWLWKVFSLFSVLRVYNILVLMVAQYIAALFILAPQLSTREILLDTNLFMLVMASALAIAGGYTINSFYDSEKDLINRPTRTMIDRLVSQRTKLSIYFISNILSVLFASYVSFRSVLFFSLYIFMLWFYSHKVKRFPFISNLLAAILTVIPFFSIFIYYQNFERVIFMHAAFLFMVISMRTMIKDLHNLKGDLVQNYRTVPVLYGETITKLLLTLMAGITLIITSLLFNFFDLGYMRYYFLISMPSILFLILSLWWSQKTWQYIVLQISLKLMLVVGAFSVAFIDISLLCKRLGMAFCM